MGEFCRYLSKLLPGAASRFLTTARSWFFILMVLVVPIARWLREGQLGMSDGQTLLIVFGLIGASFLFQMFWEAHLLHKGQRNQIGDLERAPSIRRQVLGGWRRFGVQLLGERVATEDALSDWEKRVDDWHATVGDCLTKFYDSARADSVLLLGTHDKNRPFDGSLNDYHRLKRLMLKDRLERLATLLETDSL